jgi:hypothetical protein
MGFYSFGIDNAIVCNSGKINGIAILVVFIDLIGNAQRAMLNFGGVKN